MQPTAGAVKLFHEGTLALAQVERNGMRIDTDYLAKTSAKIRKEIYDLKEELRGDKTAAELRKKYGGKANPMSPEQIGWLAFDHLGYKPLGTTKTGKYKADKEAFEFVDHPFVRKYQHIKKLEKIHGTYLSGLQREVVDGYVHPVFNLNLSLFFRSSCDSPNLQNQPARDQLAASYVRKSFIPRKGRRIIEIDFKGAEVGTSACVTRCPVLIAYVTDPTSDMHRDTASQIFSLPIEWMIQNKDWAKKTIRDWTKNRFVFPEFYGSVYFQCAPDLWKGVMASESRARFPGGDKDETIREYLARKGVTQLGDCSETQSPAKGTFEHQVQRVEQDFWGRRFRAYTAWKQRFWNEYRENGEFISVTGFRVAGEMRRNQVLNAPIQGPAFHCLLWALIRVQKWLNKRRMKTKVICQIHDSILADVVPEEEAEFLAKLKEIITVDLPRFWDWIIVPLSVEAEASEIDGNWYEKKGIEI